MTGLHDGLTTPALSKRDLPSIERLLADPQITPLCQQFGLAFIKSKLRDLQQHVRMGADVPAWSVTASGYAQHLAASLSGFGYRPVFNLTGTIIHTNLGRALLSPELWRAIEPLVTRPMNLEYDLETGGRGKRETAVAERLARLCKAEAATVVNNGAAALLLVLNTFALGKAVPVSRGELIEIGGSFRLPEIMARSGATLLEVGTTNRTRISDFAQVADQSAMLLKVHPSNYHIEGFTEVVDNAAMAEVARGSGIPFCVDLGSGALIDLERFGLPHEPTAAEVLADGADLVTFSGDKLLGSVQSGLIVGQRHLIDALNRNPLKRALRVDKITLAVLEATLKLYENPDQLADTLPLLRTLTTPLTRLNERAQAVCNVLTEQLPGASINIEPANAQIGSGALPDQKLPSLCVTVRGVPLEDLASRLRQLTMPVVGRIQQDTLWLDMRGADPLSELIANLRTLSAP